MAEADFEPGKLPHLCPEAQSIAVFPTQPAWLSPQGVGQGHGWLSLSEQEGNLSTCDRQREHVWGIQQAHWNRQSRRSQGHTSWTAAPFSSPEGLPKLRMGVSHHTTSESQVRSRARGSPQEAGMMARSLAGQFSSYCYHSGGSLVWKGNCLGENCFYQYKTLYISLLSLVHPWTRSTSNTTRNLLSRNKEDGNKVRDIEMLSRPPQRNILPSLISKPGFADTVSAPRRHLTQDFQ